MTIGSPQPGTNATQAYNTGGGGGRPPANLGDILERVLDKGLVIAGDIQVNLLDIELLTIKLRLVIASLDTAREVGINWWENDPWLNAEAEQRSVGQGPGRHKHGRGDGAELGDGVQELKDELGRLRGRISELEAGQ